MSENSLIYPMRQRIFKLPHKWNLKSIDVILENLDLEIKALVPVVVLHVITFVHGHQIDIPWRGHNGSTFPGSHRLSKVVTEAWKTLRCMESKEVKRKNIIKKICGCNQVIECSVWKYWQFIHRDYHNKISFPRLLRN